MNQARILLIDDDADLLQALRSGFEAEGYFCDTAYDGEEGLRKLQGSVFSLVISDRIMPKRDGLWLIREIRGQKNSIPIILLTSKAEDADKIVGLEMGADDYVTKPFHFGELLARVRSILRRMEMHQSASGSASARLTFGPLLVDCLTRRVQVGEQEIRLTALEFDLLYFLASSPGVPKTREEILKQVWQTDFLGYEQSVNTAVKRLRAKLRENKDGLDFIQSIRGIGYMFKLSHEGDD